MHQMPTLAVLPPLRSTLDCAERCQTQKDIAHFSCGANKIDSQFCCFSCGANKIDSQFCTYGEEWNNHAPPIDNFHPLRASNSPTSALLRLPAGLSLSTTATSRLPFVVVC